MIFVLASCIYTSKLIMFNKLRIVSVQPASIRWLIYVEAHSVTCLTWKGSECI
jgi:hypothetical protein